MDTRHRQSAGPDLARQAEALVRSLNGVVHARIEADADRIDAIHVTAADDAAATRMAAHVRSALLAGLATPVVAGRIHVRVDPAADRAAHDEHAATNGSGTGARHRIRLIHASAPDDDDGADPGGHADPARHAPPARPAPATRPAEAGLAARPAGAPAAEPVPGDAAVRRRATDRPRLVAVDIQRRDDGRVLCRVAIAYAARVHRAEAIAIDLPGAAAQAAAQAAVRAMLDAGIHGLELAGLREVEIAGRDYVLVALRRTEGRIARDRSGSAAMIGSPERSAAEAAVAAADALI